MTNKGLIMIAGIGFSLSNALQGREDFTYYASCDADGSDVPVSAMNVDSPAVLVFGGLVGGLQYHYAGVTLAYHLFLSVCLCLSTAMSLCLAVSLSRCLAVSLTPHPPPTPTHCISFYRPLQGCM